MNDSKLLKMLQTFSLSEINAFQRYIIYRQVPEKCRVLLQIIAGTDFNDLDKAQIARQCYPEKAAIGSHIDGLIYRLYCLSKDFLAIRQMESDRQQQTLNLLTALFERNLPNEFIREYLHTIAAEAAQPHKSSHYLRGQYEKSILLQTFLAAHPQKKHLNLLNSDIPFNERFKAYSVLVELQHYCHLVNSAKLRQIDYDQTYAQDLLQQALLFAEQYEAINLYRLCLLLLLQGEEATYIRLKNALFQSDCPLPDTEKKQLFTFISNYCNQQIASGKEQYRAEMLSIYEYRLQKGLLHQQGYLMPRDVKNIVTLAIHEKRYPWAYDFLNEHRQEIAAFGRDNTYHSSLALYYFVQKKYRVAAQHLLQVDFKDVLYAADNKNLLLKIHYELGEEEDAYAVAKSFRDYLHRHIEIAKTKKKAYITFIAFTLQLFKCQRRELSITQLKRGIKTASNVSDKIWLLEKLEQLKSANSLSGNK